MPTADEVRALVGDQLRHVADATVREQITALLVPPYPVSRFWDYGAPDQTFVCWTVLEHLASNTSIAYCAEGFGPSSPWGLLFLSGPNRSIGMDTLTAA